MSESPYVNDAFEITMQRPKSSSWLYPERNVLHVILRRALKLSSAPQGDIVTDFLGCYAVGGSGGTPPVYPGLRLQVWWPADKMWYPGLVQVSGWAVRVVISHSYLRTILAKCCTYPDPPWVGTSPTPTLHCFHMLSGDPLDGVFGRFDLAALLRLPHLKCFFCL